VRPHRLASTLWSAPTSRRFSPSRLVAITVRLNLLTELGDRSSKAKAVTGHRTPKSWVLILLVALLSFACAASPERRSLPPEVESTIGTITEEIAAERYEKIYNEASELWRQDATLEQSTETFKTLRTRLGTMENRTLQSATEQQNSGGPLKGRAYIVTYRTRFHNGEGMESFTLVERDGRWLLARYFVNSTALK
jgi:hypothetical protein